MPRVPRTILNEIDIAAGGVLTRRGAGGVEIVLVHGHRYDDWGLPKGHPDPGETLQQAAVREVLEETGCAGKITSVLQPIAYLVRGVPKMVVFYRMELVQEGLFTASYEVDRIEWLPVPQALERISYKNQRDLITRTFRISRDCAEGTTDEPPHRR